MSGSTSSAARAALNVIEDLPALSLELALCDRSALAKLIELTHVRDQVDQRRRKPLAEVPVLAPVEFWRPRVPGLQVEERLQPGVWNRQRLDSILLHGHQPQ